MYGITKRKADKDAELAQAVKDLRGGIFIRTE
jgi:hypothetical protein